MVATQADKDKIKRELVELLKAEPEVRKVIIFGSFPNSPEPHDLDVAVFQDTDETYLPLALKYRRLLRSVAKQIPLDVIPVRPTVTGGLFLQDILRGEVIYERQQ